MMRVTLFIRSGGSTILLITTAIALRYISSLDSAEATCVPMIVVVLPIIQKHSSDRNRQLREHS
jgi:hypothetical protein